jgi:hypothetical protein
MVSRKQHPAELRERAVRMVFEVRAETGEERRVARAEPAFGAFCLSVTSLHVTFCHLSLRDR